MTTEEQIYELIYDDIVVKSFLIAETKGYSQINGVRKKIVDAISENAHKTVGEMSHENGIESGKSQSIPLDKHKLAACISAAIINVRPLVKNGAEGEKYAEYANEALAIWVSMEVLQKIIVDKMSEEISKRETVYAFKEELHKNYKMKFPPDSYGDKKDYFKNLCHDIGRTSDHFDIFAYSRIFYHLEMLNRLYIAMEYKDRFPEILKHFDNISIR